MISKLVEPRWWGYETSDIARPSTAMVTRTINVTMVIIFDYLCSDKMQLGDTICACTMAVQGNSYFT